MMCRKFLSVILSFILLVGTAIPAAAAGTGFFAGATLEVYDWTKPAVMFGFSSSNGSVTEVFYANDGYPIGTVTGDMDRTNIQSILDAFNDYRSVQRVPQSLPASPIKSLRSAGITTGNSVYTEEAINAEEFAAEVFRLVNLERVNAGLDQVEWDDDFFTCAQIRAEEMARQQRTGHTRPEPPQDTSKSWPANVNGVGEYNAPSVADELGVDYDWIRENAGAGYRTPQAVVEGWMNSSGHRSNILREDHTRCGVGVYQTDGQTPTGYHIFWALWLD